MNRPVEKALENLLPRHCDVLPPQLIELANSFLVQSRSKCNFKAEEEVARVYVCANLACERLKIHLDLPLIEPRPPIPPRAYEKLYKYLESQLGPSTPSRKRIRSTPSTPVQNSRLTPSKSANRRVKDQQQGKNTLFHNQKETLFPRWVGPVIRLLCKQMNTRKATAHVMAGVESVLCLPRPNQARKSCIDTLKLKLPALIASVWFFVIAKMRGQDEKWCENIERKNMVQAYFEQVRENKELRKKIGYTEEVWTGWETITEKDLNAWTEEIISGEWREMDWWRNIDEGMGVEVIVEEDEDEFEDQDNQETSDNLKQSSQKCVKTMEKYEYLSEERRQEYAEWKAKILFRIEEMIATKS